MPVLHVHSNHVRTCKHTLTPTPTHTHTLIHTKVVQCKIAFEKEPEDVNVKIGTDAFLQCEIVDTTNNSTLTPRWIVTQPNCNDLCEKLGRDTDCCTLYGISELTYPYTYNGSGVIIHNVDAAMDGSLYSCCVDFYFVQEQNFTLTCSRNGKINIIGELIDHHNYNNIIVKYLRSENFIDIKHDCIIMKCSSANSNITKSKVSKASTIIDRDISLSMQSVT